ncbi:putative folate-biopterin transporter 8, chloroplastic [Iris pallida]|uniref:Folate-biopterin transporter 8, chloroplastic n=1 Tax=Iris pallida TaxID=29817 RepID=A0AAX6FYR8_IRIPA|nr:putative folate-biopterin transporter 8, chloroplastic [Iris pallida]
MVICTTKLSPRILPSFPTPTPTPTHHNKPRPPTLHLQPPNINHPHPPKKNPNSNQKHNQPKILKPLQNPTPTPTRWRRRKGKSSHGGWVVEEEGEGEGEGQGRMWALCGFGYWVQGFRCFPWLAFNFHMAHRLGLGPSTLQLVQHAGNLPMVAKPLFGLLSDAVYIGGAHRLPYISIGVLLQALSWGTLALIPATSGMFPMLMACILLGNLGASVTEVVSDALVAEFSKTQKVGVLQTYAFIALAAGALLGNLSGGFLLLMTQDTKAMFLTFAALLGVQLALSLGTKESLLPSTNSAQSSISDNLSKQLSELITVVNEERILYPLAWLVASTALVPLLSGSIFCFQTQFLNLDPSIIGLSKVVGQLMVLSATVLYTRYLKEIPMRRLISGIQVAYALSFLGDLFLVKQCNLRLGISNEVYVLCFSALAEAVAQFKVLPFTVLFSGLCPAGCEGSLFAFFASALCLSTILSGVLGVGLASLIGVSSGDYSSLPVGIAVQIVAALIPLGWLSCVPDAGNKDEANEGKLRYKSG